MNAEKLNSAVRECLDECYSSVRPLHSVTLHATRLRQSPDWTETEVQEFEAIMLRMLAKILSDQRSKLVAEWSMV